VSLTLLPSAEVVFISWASAQADLAAIHGGRVGTKLNATLPALRVSRIGGSPPDPWRDEPVIQVECWAATQGSADLLARPVVAALPELRFIVSTGRAWSATVTSGPYWAPDDPNLSDHARYILSVELLLTP
jgi:hypothetical protein